MESTINRPIQLLTLLNALLALVLIGLGGFLSSTGYNQAIPTWPLANGELIPSDMVGGVLWEFNHRATAVVVGLLTLLLGFWLGTRDSRSAVQKLAWSAIGLILFQILLGGMGVLTNFPVWVKIVHSIASGLFFAVAVALTVVTCPTCQSLDTGGFSDKTRRGARGLTSMVFLQFAAGSCLRHTESGGLFMILLLLHALLAIGILVSAFSISLALIREGRTGVVNVGAYSVMILVLAQLVMGLMVLISGPGTQDFVGQAPLAYVVESVGHLVAGAALLGASIFVMMTVQQASAGE